MTSLPRIFKNNAASLPEKASHQGQDLKPARWGQKKLPLLSTADGLAHAYLRSPEQLISHEISTQNFFHHHTVLGWVFDRHRADGLADVGVEGLMQNRN